MKLVDVGGGVRVAVRELGAGPPVLLIHGWSLSHEVWDRQIRVLAESGHRVLAMDLRGHGESDKPLGPYDIGTLASDAAAVLKVAEVDDAVVVGWSLGAMTALRLGHDAPNLIGKIVLVASNGVAAARHGAFPFGAPAGPAVQAMHEAEHRSRIEFRRRAVADPFGSEPEAAVLDWLHRISMKTPSWAGNACMETLLNTEQVDLLGSLAVPVEQIIGTADPALSVRGTRWLHDRLGHRLVELDCGHYPMLERPDEFDDFLLSAALR
ncbi:alpha/beta fold hydrolase [Rhodococcus qingshengii]|uniref:alpha/beta fold hydrolase n=1 Tax=Rhodococcus qingshengii TaxID=334542 RepID=UPI0036DABEA2